MKRGTPDHPKMLALRVRLGVPLPMAVGVMECLWQWTAKFARQGDIGRWTDASIAQGIGWEGDAGELIAALLEFRWLDASPAHAEAQRRTVGLLVHDWPSHCEDAVHIALARAGERFADGSIPNLRRLSKKEQAEAMARYECAPSVRTACAQETHAVRPAVASAVAVAVAVASAVASAAAAPVAECGEQQQQPNPTGGEIRQPDPPRSEIERLARDVSAISGQPWEQELRSASSVGGKPDAYMRPSTIARASPEWIDRTLANLGDMLSRARAAAEGQQRREEAEAAALRIREGQVEFYRERDRRREAARAP